MRDPAAGSLSDHVHARLLELLTSAEFPVGSRLPSEQALASRFSVSRPVLRQALGRLQAEGHVQTRRGSGSFVRKPAEAVTVTFGPLSNIEDVRSFLEFRCSLECEIAAHAARFAKPAAREQIRRARLKLEEAAAAGGPAIDEDLAFHLRIAEASGNRFFITVVQSLQAHMAVAIRITRELAARPLQERFAQVCREHAAIEKAIAAEDPAAAHTAMMDHLRGGLVRLFGPGG